MKPEYEILDDALKFAIWMRNPVQFFIDVWKHRQWIPSTDQARFLKDMADLKNRYALVSAGNGTGKTLTFGTFALWSAFVLPRRVRHPYTVLVAGGSRRQSEIMYEYVVEAIRENPLIMRYVEGEPTKTQTKFRDGSWILTSACSEKFLYGHHPNLMIVDEAGLVPDKLLVDAVFRVAPKRNARLILGTTPYDYSSFFVDLWIDENRYPQFKRYHWSKENVHWIDRDAIKIARQTSEEDYRIKVLGLPTPKSGTYFRLDKLKQCRVIDEEWRKQIPTENVRTFIGVDWGMRHPTAIVVVKESQGIWYVVDTFAKKGMSGDEAIDKVLEYARMYKPNLILADSERRWEVMRLQDKGMPILAVKFHTDKELMLSNLRSMIEKSILRIPVEFTELLSQLSKYEPRRKKDDDLVDALMLACRNRVFEGDTSYQFTWMVSASSKNRKHRVYTSFSSEL